MILVTGATGKVGRHVVAALKGRGSAVRITSRDPNKAAGTLGAGIEIVEADYARPDSLAPALAGVERLFLLCGANQRKAELEIGVVDAAKAAGVRHVVKLSVLDADERSSATVLRDHRRVERHIEGLDFEWTHLRPTLFMQHLLNLGYTAELNSGQAPRFVRWHAPTDVLSGEKIEMHLDLSVEVLLNAPTRQQVPDTRHKRHHLHPHVTTPRTDAGGAPSLRRYAPSPVFPWRAGDGRCA